MTDLTIAVLPASHVDHGLTPEQLAWLLAEAVAVGAYAEGYLDHPHIVSLTVELPEELGTVPCGLHGPEMGDEPLTDDEVHYAARGERDWESRLCDRPVRQVRSVSLITGPYGDEPLVLYTAFGGPVAPREPLDPSLPEGVEQRRSEAFWRQHALSLSRSDS